MFFYSRKHQILVGTIKKSQAMSMTCSNVLHFNSHDTGWLTKTRSPLDSLDLTELGENYIRLKCFFVLKLNVILLHLDRMASMGYHEEKNSYSNSEKGHVAGNNTVAQE